MEITKRKLVECYKALDNVGQLNIEFENYHQVHDLSLNKKAMESHFEAIRIMDRPCPEYQKYTKEVNSLRSKHGSDSQTLRSAIEQLNNSDETRVAIEKENARIEKLNDELDKKVVVKNVRLIPRYNSNGDPTIRGNGSAFLNFLLKIEPLFADLVEVTSAIVEEKKTGKSK
jgi:hypothetical protein